MADIPPALDREGLPLPGNASTGETAHATSQESVSPCSCQAADELSHEDLKLISQFAPFALILIEADGKFRYLNSKFTEIFGYDLSDVPTGREWFKKAYFPPLKRQFEISATAWGRNGFATIFSDISKRKEAE